MEQDRPAFLAAVGEAERGWRRPFAALVLGSLAGLIAIGAVMLGVLEFAGWAASIASDGAVSQAAAERLLNDFGRPGRSLQSYTYELASVGLGSFAAAWAFVAVAARVYRRPVRTFLTSAPRFRWRLVALGLAVFAPIVGAVVLAEGLGGEGASSAPILASAAAWWARGLYLVVACGFLGLAALAEEILFRGWLLQQSSAFVRNTGLLLAINGVLFSAAHFDPNLGGFLIRAAMGAAWSWVVLRTGGLEFTLGAHLANNLLISLFIKPVTFAPAVRQAVDYRELAVEVASLALMVTVVEVLVRRRAMGRVAEA